eukprot:GEMP01077164.1.p1 GENE.GEMP01077164.1~~GEMP01077164.1.p1  ORF type:complete len:221 (+),score=43.91 GEMP01077164.1:178-840(+)
MCIQCDDGYRLVSDECVANTCTCVNGAPATTQTSTKCTAHETAICSSCFVPYRLADHQCLGESSCTRDDQCPKMSPKWLRCHALQKVCVQCANDKDCAHDNNRKEMHCDTAQGMCVSCTTNEHCVTESRNQRGNKLYCHPSLKACVECVDEGDCKSRTEICVERNNTCVEPVIPEGDKEALERKIKERETVLDAKKVASVLFLPLGFLVLTSFVWLTQIG